MNIQQARLKHDPLKSITRDEEHLFELNSEFVDENLEVLVSLVMTKDRPDSKVAFE